MGAFRQIQIKIWDDPYYQDLGAHEKLLFLHLLSNPHTTQCGVFVITTKQICFETALHEEIVVEGLTKFIDDKKIYHDKTSNEIMMISWLKHNRPDNPKCQRQIEKELPDIKSKKLLELWMSHAEGIYEPRKSFSKNLQEEQEEQEEKIKIKKIKKIKVEETGEQEKENIFTEKDPKTSDTRGEFLATKKELPAQIEIINYLNQLAGTRILSDNLATLEVINTRLDQGFTVQDFFDVMDKKLLDWTGTPFISNLNPFTLFKEHFETYLAEAHDPDTNPIKPTGRDPSEFNNLTFVEVLN